MYNSHRLLRVVVATSLTLLSACGQSGPLYLPQEQQENQQPASAQEQDDEAQAHATDPQPQQ
ncbi:lipoprotein [Pseudoalteromonas sp. BDTF-M6]|uniref:LPS translocon maturation chaperone LptM n=1 Tax=Pseudoalteromonas sp. BDTF-M6 TaxID=2796132 RepID=UPI001BAECD81|nr:lipoprotein [Pseudoalteromonas sp. BDTF-M6]MBS3799330.1 lipoprotein [Pseudoalteromonas sp. BDTF-M6]